MAQSVKVPPKDKATKVGKGGSDEVIVNPNIDVTKSISEAVLDFTQRRARAMVMRRFKTKIQASKRRMKGRVAGTDKLMVRARHHAIEILRTKVAGDKGSQYASLSPSEKMQIDTKVEKRKGAIARIARKLLPQIRRDEMTRVRDAASGPKNESFVSPIDEAFHQMFHKDGRVKTDRRFKIYRRIKEDTQLIEAISGIIDEVGTDIEKQSTIISKASTKIESHPTQIARKSSSIMNKEQPADERLAKDRRNQFIRYESADVNAKFESLFNE